MKEIDLWSGEVDTHYVPERWERYVISLTQGNLEILFNKINELVEEVNSLKRGKK